MRSWHPAGHLSLSCDCGPSWPVVLKHSGHVVRLVSRVLGLLQLPHDTLVKAHKLSCEWESTEFFVASDGSQSQFTCISCLSPWLQLFKQGSQLGYGAGPQEALPSVELSKGAPRGPGTCAMLTSVGTRMCPLLAPTQLLFWRKPLVPLLSLCLEGQFLFPPLSESIPGEEAANRCCSEKTGFGVQMS